MKVVQSPSHHEEVDLSLMFEHFEGAYGVGLWIVPGKAPELPNHVLSV